MVDAGQQPRILFLFNHDAAHQAAHVAGIAAALAASGKAKVIAACGTSGIMGAAMSLMPGEAANAIEWLTLDLPRWKGGLLAPLNAILPAHRLARLDHYLPLFASVDIIVAPERTCLRVKRRLGVRAPAFVFVPHGAGDRRVTYHPEMAQFDLMLVSGQKVVDEMVAHGIVAAERCRIIGYPKFDTIAIGQQPRFFANDNPVFLYNPHFDPSLSSWYDHGAQVLEFFRDNADRYNLIFAPHVMLFKKRLHYSIEYRTLRIRPNINKKIRQCSNILIDTYSPRLFDMTYTRAADVYIGDVSSQVYEFMKRRGACFFLDCEKARTDADAPRYPFWRAGEVFQDMRSMADRLSLWREIAARDRPAQERLFAYTIDQQVGKTAPQRGAEALLAYVAEREGSA